MPDDPKIDGSELEPYEPDPWERQPRETNAAWASFKAYRDLPPGVRSLAKAARSQGKAAGTLAEMSAKYGWQDRILSYDREMDRQERADVAERQRSASKRHAAAGGLAAGKALEWLAETDHKPEDAGDAVALLQAGVRVERLALGMATDLSGRVDSIPIREAQRLYSGLTEIALDMLAEEEHEIYLMRVRTMAAGS